MGADANINCDGDDGNESNDKEIIDGDDAVDCDESPRDDEGQVNKELMSANIVRSACGSRANVAQHVQGTRRRSQLPFQLPQR
jgi:hypothetical protein